jgi:hypothetical protein
MRGNEALAGRAQGAALAGAVISPVLLIKDLGKPQRFLNMLRVFKVTSPMSVGSWILVGFGASSILGAAREFTGILPRLGRAGQVTGVLLGPGLSSYTAALIANTAVPAWHDARTELPFVFAASSIATAGGLAAALTPVGSAGAARRMAVTGALAELAASELVERRVGARVSNPYRQERAGQTLRASKALTALGAGNVATRGRHRPEVLAGGLLERWGIFEAGVASSQDPAATVGPQRERLVERAGRRSRYARPGSARG